MNERLQVFDTSFKLVETPINLAEAKVDPCFEHIKAFVDAPELVFHRGAKVEHRIQKVTVRSFLRAAKAGHLISKAEHLISKAGYRGEEFPSRGFVAHGGSISYDCCQRVS